MGEPRLPETSAVPVAQFNNSIFTGGTYNIFAGKTNENDIQSASGRRKTDGLFRRTERLQSLEDIVAFDALLNSNERYPAPKCHPDTRKVALEIVNSWTWNRRAGFKSIMWVSGAPGVGKSALLQTTCEALATRWYNPIQASFFFARGQGARELVDSFAPTVAYQFSSSSIICRWYTWYLLRNEPAILREAFHSQFRKLVIAPASARSYVQCPMVVVIDGLDECINAQDRVSLLELIFEAATTQSIRFLIASRPEQEIENFFERPDVAQHVDRIILDEETFKTSKDIRIFLRSEFARIRKLRADLVFPTIDGKEWPGDAIINRVTVDSDGQFILPTLFTSYLDDEVFSPQEQLESLLNPPSHVIAFSKLDRLYHQILTRCPRHMHQGDAKFVGYQETVRGILRVVAAWPEQLSIDIIAELLGEETHIVQHIVRAPLKTLFKFQGSGLRSKIAFCHKSLGDCLLDPRRSGNFHVPPNALDLLYHHILSRPPPSDPAKIFTQEQLIGVLHVVVAWPGDSTKVKIGLVLGLKSGTVDRAVLPFMDLLFKKQYGKNSIGIRFASFKDFLLDPHRSGQFHVPPNALDLLYLRILAQPLPSDCAGDFSRELFARVFHVIVAWPMDPTEDEIASALGVDRRMVSRIVAHFMFLLVQKSKRGSLQICSASFKDFLLDPQRSGEFHIPPNALDLLYLHILSRPLHPTGMFCREQLVGVLYAIVAWPKALTVVEIASMLGLDSDTVSRIVNPFMGLLVKERYGTKTVVLLGDSFKTFLLDPHRSAGFHVPSNALDLLYLRILSRRPPAGRISQELLIGVLHVLVAWPGDPTGDEIARMLDSDSDTITWVITPFMGFIFKKQYGTETVEIRDSSFREFLLDPHRSAGFHVPPNALDLLYLRILSRPPPPTSAVVFSREQLVGVLHVIVAWPVDPTEDEIALVVDVDIGTVRRIFSHFTDILFKEHGREKTLDTLTQSFKSFLSNPRRSGEFHVPPNALDLLYLRILSRPPPADSAGTVSREQLVQVLRVLVSSLRPPSKDEIALTLQIDSHTVSRIVTPFVGLLIATYPSNRTEGIVIRFVSFRYFLFDSNRSGEFHTPP